jgi:ferric-dicitrate binding protein FerR (iron transport regulator)
MKKMNKNMNLSDREWEELASVFSGEKDGTATGSANDEIDETEKQWKKLRNMGSEKQIDVDKAWKNVQARIQEAGSEESQKIKLTLFRSSAFMRIAAAALIILGIGAITFFTNRSVNFSNEISITSNENQRNLQVDLPDGSRIFLNRNSELRYRTDFGKDSRAVKLTGEAFFEISPDKEKPFSIDAGKAIVQVVGTSFSVLTDNGSSEVEVFVKTGKVLLSEKSDNKSLQLDPGYIGRTDSGNLGKSVNEDPNYLAWNTGKLEYKGDKLEIVFRDLKKFYNMNIVADDPSIMELPWTSPIDYESQDKIIFLICRSFNLSYSKVGDVYHLSEK